MTPIDNHAYLQRSDRGHFVKPVSEMTCGPFFGFRECKCSCVNVADSEVYLLDGTYLGTTKQVQTYLDTTNL